MFASDGLGFGNVANLVGEQQYTARGDTGVGK